MDTRVTMELDLSESDIDKIVDAMSESMGGYIQGLEKFDFTTWSKDEWRHFLRHGAETAIANTLMKRIIIVPPVEVEHVPF